ncbi:MULTISPECIES: hypothetical protein [Pseudoalteromonas]|uniref:Uncharacterized protein n=1 Tax=Pseudoalteromonas maricaloris TaxID=184924 RepID=A0A8I2H603_9GAMM|nr:MULTISPECIES: hypothetical protein [Pseudoalteromonas]KID34911.1 hypothetical protein QT15_17620 [Pseudoalteromonas flavipulchra NCIMB 2033 = ATCC BAA-314]KJY94911.1 hypothetical protein TW73_17365 [Pseudoalteromonas piscicida]MBD0784136.1 hypothetical protein [Pseudoalteromonas flavipulchra]MBE0372961.1 hypothetical protein [Pseudoalteromonas flavipulchra NCIMB 2033 = ATCC BAA-314]NLR23643.1 hypothetical protein [Pseudoalteromonas maricaloris]
MEFHRKVDQSCQEALCKSSPLKPILIRAISERRASLQAIINDLTEGAVSPTKMDVLLSQEAEKVSLQLLKEGNLSKRDALAASEKAIFTLARNLL